MSIIGGLVGSDVSKLADARRNPLAEWAERNAWVVLFAGSVAFWLVLGAVLLFA